jgi:hypothetical protein
MYTLDFSFLKSYFLTILINPVSFKILNLLKEFIVHINTNIYKNNKYLISIKRSTLSKIQYP